MPVEGLQKQALRTVTVPLLAWMLVCQVPAVPHAAGGGSGAAGQDGVYVDADSTQLSVLQAEDRRARGNGDMAILRAGLHSRDPQTVRMAARALGRLERPAVIADLAGLMRHPAPEVRAEAANAIAQAAAGWKADGSVIAPAPKPVPGAPPAPTLEGAQSMLITRLHQEAEDTVISALSEAIGRLPYTSAALVSQAETAILSTLGMSPSAEVRLGVAAAGESLTRISARTAPVSSSMIAALRGLAQLPPGTKPTDRTAQATARIRRLAVQALVNAKSLDADIAQTAARDSDAQVRVLAIKALAGDAARVALTDESAMVRQEAARVVGLAAGDASTCGALLTATRDKETRVALAAIDALARCGSHAEAVGALADAADAVPAEPGRTWHRAAHALVALATASPETAHQALPRFYGSPSWQVRMYLARAAALLADRVSLERLANDPDDNVREAAVAGLSKLVGHEADAIYRAQLERPGYQLLRAAAQALKGASDRDATLPALASALKRLTTENHDNSRDAQAALLSTIDALSGVAPPLPPVASLKSANDLKPGDLRKLRGARVRVTIRGVGAFELALIAQEAPLTVARFVRLAESGYYNGLTFHRIVPNFVIQGGSPGANEYIGDASYMRDEVGMWPHVRGAVGVSTRGRDTGDAQLFVDLTDVPRLDHEYTVFAHVLNGIDIIDAILEGDVIEKIERLP